MALSNSHPPAIEGQTVTNWRLIWITGALEVLFLTGLLVTWRLLPVSRPKPAAAPGEGQIASVSVQPQSLPIRAGSVPIKEPEKPRSKSPPPPVARWTKGEKTAAVIPAPRQVTTQPKPQPLKAASAAPKTQSNVLAPQAPKASSRQASLEVRQEPIAPADPLPMKRINYLHEYVLANMLRQNVPEFDLDVVKGAAARLLARAKDDKTPEKIESVLDLLPKRQDLSALPFRKGAECQLDKTTAKELQTYSRTLRQLLPSSARMDISLRHSPGMRTVYFQQTFLNDPAVRKPLEGGRGTKNGAVPDSAPNVKEGAVRALVQLLQAEEEPGRLVLVDLLAVAPTRLATVALARLAMFDLSPAVREMAIEVLKERSLEEIRPLFLDGLRYPWPPVADHAAEALVALQDKQAIPRLVALLDRPDPASPVLGENKKWTVSEVVRVNHLRNCVLCHAPSFDRNDMVRAPVPTPGEPLPRVYYAKFEGKAIRADVTYLRQDFSLCQPVPEPGKWPEQQRYDYLIRKRELTGDETKQLKDKAKPGTGAGAPNTYAQRDAVLFALRELTGKDAGVSKDAWEKDFLKKSP